MTKIISHTTTQLPGLSVGRGVFTLAVVLVVFAAQSLVAQSSKRMTPTVPGAAGDPVWQGAVKMSDGRTFVTDGGFAIDAAIAKVATLPERQFPSRVLEEYLKAPQKAECRSDELTRSATGKTYQTPSEIALSTTYVDFLRRTLPARSLRFRTNGPSQPVLVVADGKLIGVMMPVAQ